MPLSGWSKVFQCIPDRSRHSQGHPGPAGTSFCCCDSALHDWPSKRFKFDWPQNLRSKSVTSSFQRSSQSWSSDSFFLEVYKKPIENLKLCEFMWISLANMGRGSANVASKRNRPCLASLPRNSLASPQPNGGVQPTKFERFLQVPHNKPLWD